MAKVQAGNLTGFVEGPSYKGQQAETATAAGRGTQFLSGLLEQMDQTGGEPEE